MDIVVNLNDDIEQKARRKAKGEGFSSLRGWISYLVTKEVQHEPNCQKPSLLEALADEQIAHRHTEF